jgi:hypothetical protein
MNKKIPKIFVNKIDKNIDNNTKVYYSYKDDFKEEYIEKNVDYFEIQNKINNLFKSSDFVYKKKFLIKTNNFEKEFIIISKSFNYLLTIDGYKILIKDIIDIKSL